MEPTPSIVIVLGMHRSGTSALTRIVNLLGARLGDDLLPASENDNETGFWERSDLVEIHERILLALGRNHLDDRPLPRGWEHSPRLARPREQIRSIVEREVAAAPLFAVKDPRLCRLLPLWLPILRDLALEPSFLLSLRDPREVARSLARRNRLAVRDGLALWLTHNLEAERHSRSFRRHFLSYPRLLEDWKRELSAAERSLDRRWPVRPDAIEDEVAAFLRPDLRHHRREDDDWASDAVPPEVRRVFERLEAACTTQQVDTGALDRIARRRGRVGSRLGAAVRAWQRRRDPPLGV